MIYKKLKWDEKFTKYSLFQKKPFGYAMYCIMNDDLHRKTICCKLVGMRRIIRKAIEDKIKEMP